MRKDILIGDESVEMAANAASTYLYKKIFHSDFEKRVAADDTIEAWREMAFVLAMQAEEGETELLEGKITESDFITWLARFEYSDLVEALNDVASLFEAQKKTTAKPKKKGA